LVANEQQWRLDEVRALATVATADEAGLTLGVATGSLADVHSQLDKKIKVNRAMQERVVICQDAQTEHVLNRQSLGIGRVNHILRVHGGDLAEDGELLDRFDRMMFQEMDRLFPGLTDDSHEQATLSAAVGGLGWRKASDTARPANLGALVMAAPKVKSMAGDAVRAGLLSEGQLEAKIDAKIRKEESAFLCRLDEPERIKAEDFLQKAKGAAENAWSRMQSPQRGAGIRAPRAEVAYAGHREHAPVQIADVQDGGDADSGAGGRAPTTAHVQKELAKLQDCSKLRALEAKLFSKCNWPQLDRLRELRHPEVSHAWLWHLNAYEGAVLTEADYIVNIQKRLGARVQEAEVRCRLCGVCLDPFMEHCEVCALGEATKGHYAVVRAVVDGIKLADAAVTTEPAGLSSTQARPADIFTNAAVPGRSAALDVCIASPNAAGAAGDAAEAAFKRKLEHYQNIIPELHAAGVAFRPLIWTSDGRPHPATTRTLKYAAERAARKGGGQVSASALQTRWKHEITVAILRRRAAMTRAVMPKPHRRQEWLLTGRTEAEASSAERSPQLDESDDEDEGPAEDVDWDEEARTAGEEG